MSLFFYDSINNLSVSWDDLIVDLNGKTTFNSYCKSENYYEIFKNIIFSLLINEEIILLDSDFTDSELISLTGHNNYSIFSKLIDKSKFPYFKNKFELINILRNSSENWRLTLYTSGTTGLPKKVSHNFKSITRFLKYSESIKDNIWGFAYNPTHIAGVQVFLQALLNTNSIIRLFGMKNKDIYKQIDNFKITHISATPTFYRLLLPFEKILPSVVRITSGGEKFSDGTINQLKEIFPNAKITNIYASTEAGTLFASQNDIFTVRSEFEHLIKIENNELIIHKSFLGETDAVKEDWYHTGDIIEFINLKPLQFRFINRNSDMINVGGYKVNPLEVEEAILTFPGIKGVKVYPRKNSILGNIICCEVVPNDNLIKESSVRSFLQSKIQEFKIPRIITFVEELSTTRSGKLKRN